MNHKRILIVTLALLVFAAPALYARPGNARAPRLLMQHLKFGLQLAENNLFEARMILRLKAEIGLSAAQEKRIEDMMLAHEEQGIRRGADIKVLEVKFAALLREEKINRKEMEKLARQLGQLRTDLQVDHLNYLLDVRDVLSQEQVAKLDQLKRKMRSRMMERFPNPRRARPFTNRQAGTPPVEEAPPAGEI